MKSLILTAIAALVVFAMPVQAAEKPAANKAAAANAAAADKAAAAADKAAAANAAAADKAANLSAGGKMSLEECNNAIAECKGEAKCLSDLEAKGCTKAR